MTPVKVEWIDSCASNKSWILLEELEEDIEPIFISTYGMLVKEEDSFIVVAQNYGTDPEQVCNLMTIPRGCIKSITEL